MAFNVEIGYHRLKFAQAILYFLTYLRRLPKYLTENFETSPEKYSVYYTGRRRFRILRRWAFKKETGVINCIIFVKEIRAKHSSSSRKHSIYTWSNSVLYLSKSETSQSTTHASFKVARSFSIESHYRNNGSILTSLHKQMVDKAFSIGREKLHFHMRVRLSKMLV